MCILPRYKRLGHTGSTGNTGLFGQLAALTACSTLSSRSWTVRNINIIAKANKNIAVDSFHRVLWSRIGKSSADNYRKGISNDLWFVWKGTIKA